MFSSTGNDGNPYGWYYSREKVTDIIGLLSPKTKAE
jgi:hypothetical protein